MGLEAALRRLECRAAAAWWPDRQGRCAQRATRELAGSSPKRKREAAAWRRIGFRVAHEPARHHLHAQPPSSAGRVAFKVVARRSSRPRGVEVCAGLVGTPRVDIGMRAGLSVAAPYRGPASHRLLGADPGHSWSSMPIALVPARRIRDPAVEGDRIAAGQHGVWVLSGSSCSLATTEKVPRADRRSEALPRAAPAELGDGDGRAAAWRARGWIADVNEAGSRSRTSSARRFVACAT